MKQHNGSRGPGPVHLKRTGELAVGVGTLQPAFAQPTVDTLGDGLPPWFEHHVMTHGGKELCFSAVRASRRTYFFLGVRAVLLSPQNQQRSRDTLGSG